MGSLLGHREPPDGIDLEHVRIVPSPLRTGVGMPTIVVVEVLQDGFPCGPDVPRRSPGISHVSGPGGWIADPPLAETVKDLSVGGLCGVPEGVPHGFVALADAPAEACRVAVIVFEVVDLPRCVGFRILQFVSVASRTTLAGEEPRIAV